MNTDPMMVAKIILEQMGGRKFTTMTGAKNFCGGPNYLAFTIPGNMTRKDHKITQVKVTLTPRDTYDMEFSRLKGGLDLIPVAKHEGIYADQLQEIFTAETGMHTSL